MCNGGTASFTLDDLAVFDATHLREVIGTISGAVSPQLLGRALSDCQPEAPSAVADLAASLERALSPADRETFCRARVEDATVETRESARCAVLQRLYWELTYWKTPEEYERLTAGEQVHLGALDVARVDGAIVLDAGAGSGRVTLPLARRARLVYALDPAPPMLRLLERKVAAASLRNVEVVRGTFRRVPLPDESVDAVIACSAFGADEARGGQCGLEELWRVTRHGGRIVILWPDDPAWFMRHGFQRAVLPGPLSNTFASLEDAWAVATRFYGPLATRYLEARGRPELPFHVLGVRSPRDVCWLTVDKRHHDNVYETRSRACSGTRRTVPSCTRT